MTRPPPVTAVPHSPKKKVLLISANGPRRNLRENVLRRHGLEVVCTAYISDARLLWHPAAYDLVLFDLRQDGAAALEFCAEMKDADSGQLIAFLVGQPEYLAASPGVNRCSAISESPSMREQTFRGLMATACEALPRRGGFLEAVWRMSLTRAAKSPELNACRQIVTTAASETAASSSFGAAVRRAELAQVTPDGKLG